MLVTDDWKEYSLVIFSSINFAVHCAISSQPGALFWAWPQWCKDMLRLSLKCSEHDLMVYYFY